MVTSFDDAVGRMTDLMILAWRSSRVSRSVAMRACSLMFVNCRVSWVARLVEVTISMTMLMSRRKMPMATSSSTRVKPSSVGGLVVVDHRRSLTLQDTVPMSMEMTDNGSDVRVCWVVIDSTLGSDASAEEVVVDGLVFTPALVSERHDWM